MKNSFLTSLFLYLLILVSGTFFGLQAAAENDDPYMIGIGLGLDYPAGPGTFTDSADSRYDFSGWFRYRLSNEDALQLGYDHLQFKAKPDYNPFPAADDISAN